MKEDSKSFTTGINRDIQPALPNKTKINFRTYLDHIDKEKKQSKPFDSILRIQGEGR